MPVLIIGIIQINKNITINIVLIHLKEGRNGSNKSCDSGCR
jgi:hypothetical protein